ncbi:MAG: GNAT family N-acetyltransferase [Alphaproteobacteria bacterium]|nr:GNAT family N-acetyltransferase [Alphaproteobacteria bacterium]
MTVTIQKIEKEDLAVWTALRKEHWPYHDDLDFLRKEAEEILDDPNADAFFAFYDGELAGFTECAIRSEAPGCQTNNIGYLEGWYVKPAFQRHGIGRTLVETVENWARERGCTEMASDTVPRDFPHSPVAHQSLGYKIVDEKVHFKKML